MAAEIIPSTLDSWVVGVVATAIISALGFLVRSAFTKVETGIESLGAKLDALKEGMARSDTRSAVLEARIVVLERDVAELRRDVSEGVVR